MNSLKRIFGNKWVKFSLVAVVYVLWFVVWTRNWWMILGVAVIYDIYISKYMYRWFWRRHKERKKTSRPYKKTAEWAEAILFAVIAASLIRIFFFEMYVIPSSSMEKSLLVNDYLCVSKVAYGPRMPMTPVAFPLVHHTMPLSTTKRSFSEIIQRPYRRLAGCGDVQRGDIVVFNFPAGDSVLLEVQNELSYYDALRDFQARYGPQEGRRRLHETYTVITRPVDKRENYVKRAVGVPGDTITIVHSNLYVNGKPFAEIPGMQFLYTIYTDGTAFGQYFYESMGITVEETENPAPGIYSMPLTAAMAEKVRSLSNVAMVIKQEMPNYGEDRIFPNDSQLYPWTLDNFGPLWVPTKGATVELDLETLPLYERIIDVYEGNDLEVRGGTIYINGSQADSYTFAMDYYFMMGDNRHMSLDSRFWGFVPQDHIVGKPVFVWLSLDKDKGLFGGKIRWHRMFRSLRLE